MAPSKEIPPRAKRGQVSRREIAEDEREGPDRRWQRVESSVGTPPSEGGRGDGPTEKSPWRFSDWHAAASCPQLPRVPSLRPNSSATGSGLRVNNRSPKAGSPRLTARGDGPAA